MEIATSMELNITVYQLMALLISSTLALFFGRIKLALLINYVFTMYWGYFFNRDLVLSYLDNQYYFSIAYFGLGIVVAILSMIAFIFQHEK